MPDASQIDDAAYSLGKNRINQDSTLSQAATTYADVLRKQRAASTKQSMDWNYARGADNTAYAASSRGFGKRGASYSRSWGDYNQGRNAAYGDYYLNQQVGDYSTQQERDRIARSQTRGLEDLELGEFNRKANLAASLRAGTNVAAGGGAAALSPGSAGYAPGALGTLTAPDGTIGIVLS